jgi:hypothetical protein
LISTTFHKITQNLLLNIIFKNSLEKKPKFAIKGTISTTLGHLVTLNVSRDVENSQKAAEAVSPITAINIFEEK